MEQWPTQVTCNQPGGTSNLPCKAMAHSHKFHRALQLLQDYFTGHCNCYRVVSQDLASATGLFHYALQLLQGHFTVPCNCYRAISLYLAIATGLFHKTLQMQHIYFTRGCNCYRIISQDLANATGLFHYALQLLPDYFIGPRNWIIYCSSEASYLILSICSTCSHSAYREIYRKLGLIVHLT